MNRMIILLLALGLSACAAPPRTANEFREGFKGAPATAKVERQDLSRPFTIVFNDVRDNANRCLNVFVAGTTGAGESRKETIRYRSYTKKTSSMNAEMVLQSERQAAGAMPSGGYYVLLADLEAVAADKTRVTIYGPSMLYGDVFDAVFSWANGKSRVCPALP